MDFWETWMLMRLVIEVLSAAPAIVEDIRAAASELKSGAAGEDKLRAVLAALQEIATQIENVLGMPSPTKGK